MECLKGSNTNVFRQIFSALIICLSTVTASASDDRDAKIRSQLSDIQIYNEFATVLLNGDGTLFAQVKSTETNKVFAVHGTWRIVDGKFCRNLKKAPKGIDRKLCEHVKIRGRTVSFDGLKPDGRKPVVYRVR